MSWRVAVAIGLPGMCSAHAPVFDHGTSADPLHLGDATSDSWAICLDTSRQDAAYFSFSATDERSNSDGDFWMGIYTPGCARENQLTRCRDSTARFTVAVWGLEAENCGAWAGWGDTPLQPLQNASGKAPGGAPLSTATVFVSPRAIRSEAPVYEPFTPTVFTPRGSCVASYPPAATNLTMAVWSERGHEGHTCIGLGRAERSVYSAQSLLLSSRWRWELYRWGRWSVTSLMWPIAVIAPLLHRSSLWCDRYTPERWLSVVVAAQVVGEMILCNWALSIASSEGASGVIAPALRIALPLGALAALSPDTPLNMSLLALTALIILNMAFVGGPVVVMLARLRREGKL